LSLLLSCLFFRYIIEVKRTSRYSFKVVFLWSGLVWSGLVWSGLVWSGLVWSGLVWSGLAWSGLVWSGLVWSGLVWSGLVWSGLVWSGLVWSGLVCLLWTTTRAAFSWVWSAFCGQPHALLFLGYYVRARPAG
jgi:hypothetical protein